MYISYFVAKLDGFGERGGGGKCILPVLMRRQVFNSDHVGFYLSLVIKFQLSQIITSP